MNNQEKVMETLDQMVLPASTADVYNRMLKLGYFPGNNAPRERGDVSSYLGKLRKAGKIISHHEDGVLLWSFGTEFKQRQPTDAVKEVRDTINYMRGNITQQVILAELFDELASSLTHAAKMLRSVK